MIGEEIPASGGMDPGPPVGLNPGVEPEKDYRTLRYEAYIAPDGPDAIFMKWQRGEATEQDWLDSVQLIKDTYPEEES